MAEADPWSRFVPCRYFYHGICRAGDNCRYLHDRTRKPTSSDQEAPSPSSAPQGQVCRFYLRGCCNYGDKCRFEHTGHVESSGSSFESAKKVKDKAQPGNRHINLTKNCSGSPPSKMVVLKKGSKSADSNDSGIDMDGPSRSPPGHSKTKTKKPEDWVKAAEFVPGQPYKSHGIGTYSHVASSGLFPEEEIRGGFPVPAEPATEATKKLLCPFAAQGECRYGENCIYTHGDICDLCFLPCLHPTDEDQRRQHREECMAEIEKDMEESFAFQRSKEMSCGICMEVIMEKEPATERRFGILSHCSHCFCLSCIRKWRQAKQFENKVVRACPECRKTSDFVTPSEYWVETKEEKEKLIEGYKKALGQKSCKYFNQGKGECPFNERCFYKHALPDGTIVEATPRPRRRRQNADGESDILQSVSLWEFLEDRDMLYDLFVSELLEEILYPSWEDPDWQTTDSDDSDDDFFDPFNLLY